MADSDRRVVRAPLRSATKSRKKELDKARLATRVKNQKGRWDRLKTVLKMKDSKVAEILFDTLVHFLITILGLARVLASDRYPEPRSYGYARLCLGKIVRPTLRLWGESPHRVLLTREFGLSVAKWLRN